MKKDINPGIHDGVLALLRRKGFSVAPSSVKISIATDAFDSKYRPLVRYTVGAVVSHPDIKRDNDCATRLKISMGVDKGNMDWLDCNSDAQIDRLLKYLDWRLDYLIKHGTFSALNFGIERTMDDRQ